MLDVNTTRDSLLLLVLWKYSVMWSVEPYENYEKLYSYAVSEELSYPEPLYNHECMSHNAVFISQ
jgi:hypothetical protein